MTSLIATSAQEQYGPLYFAQSTALFLLSNTPKQTLDGLLFQISVWYKINSFLNNSFKILKLFLAVMM